MRQYQRLFDALMAGELQRALEEQGIESQVTIERENAYLGRMQYVVWAAEGADAHVMDAAYQAVQVRRQRMSEEADRAVTRVSVAEDLVKCRNCDYNLRGQEQDGKCPECGYPYQIIQMKVCPKCRAEMPCDFEVCWNCSGDESGEDEA